MDLYDENGNKIGFYAICNWWFESYPEDIFVKEPAEVIQIRELMKSLVKKSKVGINTKVKKLLKSRLCQDCEIGDDKGWSDLCPINCKYRKRKKVVKMTYSQHQKDILKSKNEI